MLLTTGERVSAALLTMALADLGVDAVSFTGSQVGIITDTVARQGQDRRGQGRPRPRGARRRQGRRRRRLPGREHRQGDHDDGPRRRPTPPRRRSPRRSTPTPARSTPTSPACSRPTRASCRRPASSPASASTRCSRWPAPGSKVLALRSVEFARNHGVAAPRPVELHVGAGHVGHRRPDEEPGRSMEDPIISGVVTDVSESKVTVLGVPDRPGISAALFEPLAAANVNVDMIVQNTSTEGTTDISFTVPIGRHGASPRRSSAGSPSEIGADGRDPRRRHRQGVARRRRHEVVAGHRRQDVPHARRRGRQHRDDLDVDDPHLGRRRQRATSSGPPARCTRRSVSTAAGVLRRPLPERKSAHATQALVAASVAPRARGRWTCERWPPRRSGTLCTMGRRLAADPVEDGGARPTTRCERRRGRPARPAGSSTTRPADTLTLAEFVATGDNEVLAYLDVFGLRTPDNDAAHASSRSAAGIGRMTCAFTRRVRRRCTPATSTPASSSAAARPWPGSARSTACARSTSPTDARSTSPTTSPTSRSATSRSSTASATTPLDLAAEAVRVVRPGGRSRSTSARGRAPTCSCSRSARSMRGLFRSPGARAVAGQRRAVDPAGVAGQPARPRTRSCGPSATAHRRRDLAPPAPQRAVWGVTGATPGYVRRHQPAPLVARRPRRADAPAAGRWPR